MSIKENITSNAIAIVLSAAASTAANVTALNVHLSYQQASIDRIELAQMKQAEKIRHIELAQAANGQ
tara:strand:- start:23 stop:223 length:201 start_codon:yes stop_codon:yes gene_type:complete